MRVLWIVGSRDEARSAVVASAVLREAGIFVEFASELEDTLSFLGERGLSVVSIVEGISGCTPLDARAIEELDRRFPRPGVHFLAFAEARAQRIEGVTALYPHVARHLDFWARRFAATRPDAVVIWQTASLANRAPISVARARGVQTLIFVNGPSFSRCAIADIDESENWSDLLALVARTQDFRLEEAGRRMALDHVQEISQLHSQFKPRPTPLWPGGALITAWLRSHFEKLPRAMKSPAQINWNVHWQRVAWAARANLGLIPYHRFDPSERYIYFPMQNLADVKLTGRNPIYADQIALAEHIALSMRPGLTFYVREHPNHPGMYDLGRLKRLMRGGSVKLVHPYDSNIELVRHAAAVVCVNSTAGWEAYVNKVPLIVLGNPFFRRSRLVYGVDSLNDLSENIRQAVDKGAQAYHDRSEEWLWFIWAALTTCAPGYPWGYKEIFGAVPKQDEELNGRLLGRALLARLQRIYDQKSMADTAAGSA